jgi:hypothetical protein
VREPVNDCDEDDDSKVLSHDETIASHPTVNGAMADEHDEWLLGEDPSNELATAVET